MTLSPGLRFRADDIWDAPDDNKRYEVIDGELYVAPAPDWGHQSSLSSFLWRIGAHVHAHDLGKVVTAPVGVVLDEENGVQPDLVYVSREREHIIVARGVEGAPDLLMEVLSPSTQTRDRGIKMRRYALAGVAHYWIYNHRTRRLETYELGPDGYTLSGTYGPGDIFRPALFPGLEIPIDEV